MPQDASMLPSSPWEVTSLPNWGRHQVDEVMIETLDQASFLANYVNHWRPVVVRGACSSWPAVARWRDIEYLRRSWGAAEVPIWTRPNPQMGRGRNVERIRQEAWYPGHFADILEDDPSHPDMSVRFYPLEKSILQGMGADLGLESFTAGLPKPRMYPRLRLFAYRGGVSLWHSHPTDEHLTYQVVGKKRFALLGPEFAGPIARVTSRELYSFSVDVRKYPEYLTMTPLCCELNAGDAIYIPPFWWHTVQPSDLLFGATVATTWASRISTHVRHLHHIARPAFRPLVTLGVQRIPTTIGSALKRLCR